MYAVIASEARKSRVKVSAKLYGSACGANCFTGLPRFARNDGDFIAIGALPVFFRLVAILLLCLMAGKLYADDTTQDDTSSVDTANPPANFSADTVQYNETEGTISAEGKVIVTREGRQLTADELLYNQPQDRIIAKGNVTLTDDGGAGAGGSTATADSVKLSGNLEQADIDNVELRLRERARFRAKKAKRNDGVENVLQEAAFTACPVCEKADGTTTTPLWQIKADTIIHNEADKIVEYNNATVEVAGFPVFWLPYLRHADPTIARKSGFLAPTVASSSDRGIVISTPYYYPLAPYRDVTLIPIVTTEAGYILGGEYRERFINGEIEVAGSAGSVNQLDGQGGVTDVQREEGHIDAEGQFDLTDKWRTSFNVERVSNRTYLRRFDFSNADILQSNITAERFSERGYFSGNAFAFQGLRVDDDEDQTPLVLPELNYSYQTTPQYWGGSLSFDASALSLTRAEGTDTHRLSTSSFWERQGITDFGGKVTGFAGLHSDIYQVSNQQRGTTGNNSDGPIGRFVPMAGLTYQHPLVRRTENFQQFIEPVVGLVVSPNGGNPEKIPNEDAVSFEFDEHNMFLANRFTAEDRIASGQRLDYGVNLGFYGLFDSRIDSFIGQSYQLQPSNAYGNGSGLNDNTSDIVGATSITWPRSVTAQHRFRIDEEDGALQRNEFSLDVTSGLIQWRVDYLALNERENVINDSIEELSGEASVLLGDNYLLSGRIAQDLDNGVMRYADATIAWYNDCLSIGLSYERDFVDDPATPEENVIMFRVNFDHLSAESAREFLLSRNRLRRRDLRQY